MATKTKTAGINETAETALKNGTETFRDGIEKAAKAYDHFLGFGKEMRP